MTDQVGFVAPTVLFAGVLVVAVLLLWMATFALRRLRRGRQRRAAARAQAAPPGKRVALAIEAGPATSSATRGRRVPPTPTAAPLLVELDLPGVALDAAHVGDLVVRAASVVSPALRTREPGQSRQDAYRLGRDPQGQHLVIAVAGGASPLGRSGVGANLASNAIVDELCRRLGDGIAIDALTAAEVFATVAQSMVDGAKQRGIPVVGLHTTLVAMIVPVKPDADGRRSAWLGYVGESSAWLRLGTRWQRLSEEAAAIHLPFNADQSVAALVDLPPRAVVALMTEGLADTLALLAHGQRHLAARWWSPPAIGAFLSDVDLTDPVASAEQLRDDRTAVVVWCGAA